MKNRHFLTRAGRPRNPKKPAGSASFGSSVGSHRQHRAGSRHPAAGSRCEPPEKRNRRHRICWFRRGYAGCQPHLSLLTRRLYCAFEMVYHSSFVDDDGITKACGCPLLPLKTHIKGPAPASDPDKADIVDEAITFFRANVFFKNFHVKSPADKLLIYLTFYINIALKRLEGCRTLAVGTKAIINLGLEKVPVPGEPGFPFPGLFTLPQSQKEAELLRNYLKQIREETSGRLLNCAYRANGFPNKWWLAFAKRKFMNIVIL